MKDLFIRLYDKVFRYFSRLMFTARNIAAPNKSIIITRGFSGSSSYTQLVTRENHKGSIHDLLTQIK